MSTLVSTPPAQPPLPASALPNGGSRELAEDVFQTAEEAVLVQGTLPVKEEVEPHSRPFMSAIRSHVAARPCQSALLAAAAGALAMLVLRRRLRGRFTLRSYI
jgi:hypothetical protein